MAELEVIGLKEFNAALVRASAAVSQVIQPIALAAAVIVVEDAVPTIPRRSGRAAKSVGAFVTGGGAVVSAGKGVDYFSWLARGGKSGRNLSNVRPIVEPDRYINPAYKRNQDKIAAMAQEKLTKALKDAGLEVK